jgi:hypothetical protein
MIIANKHPQQPDSSLDFAIFLKFIGNVPPATTKDSAIIKIWVELVKTLISSRGV